MKKRSKFAKLLALILAVGMLASGCGQATDSSSGEQSDSSVSASETESSAASETGEGETSETAAGDYPISDEVITVTVTGAQGSTPDWNATLQVEEIEKRLGIKLDCQPFADDAWQTQLTLMMASDELPDLIINAADTMVNFAEYGADGYILPINEYMDYAPNLAATMEESPEYASAITSPDGNIYALATYNGNKLGRISRSFINKVWLENVGMDVPTTVDELYDVLVAFRDEDANGNGDPDDEIPFSTSFAVGAANGTYAEQTLLSAFGIVSNKATYVLQDVDGQVQLMDISENYKEYLRYMNKLYSEGLMDSESFIQTGEEFRAKAAEDRVGFYGDAAPIVAASKDISYDSDFAWVGGLTSSMNEERTVVLDPPAGSNAVCAISATTEYPVELVRLLDYFYSDEGTLAGARGFEGVSWEWEEVPGVPDAEVATVITVDEYPSAEEFRYKKAVINNGFQIVSPYYGTQYPVIIEADDETLAGPLLEEYGWAALIEMGTREEGITMVDSFPNLVYTSDESQERATLYNDISLYLANAKAQFITGEMDIDADWETHVNTLNQMGLERILEIEQAAYDRMNSEE